MSTGMHHEHDSSSVRIIIAADDPSIAQATAIRLKNYNLDWDVADICLSGRETIEKAKLLHPDIVLIDMNIRGIHGFDVIRLIRDTDPLVRFIVIAPTKDSDTILTALRLGVSDVFISPVNQETLLSSLDRIANSVLLEKEAARQKAYGQERMETALRMIKKDYINLLVKSDSTQVRRLISYAKFLGVEEQPGFMIAILQRKKKPTFQMPETIIYRLSTQYSLIGKSIQPGLSVAFLSSPPDGEQYRAEVLNVLDELLISYQQEGEDIVGSAGSIDMGALQMKTSLLQALTALNYKETVESPYQHCIVYDPEIMSLPGSKESVQVSSSPVIPSKASLDQAITYIEQNYHHNLTLADVANSVNLSPYYFCHIFKKYTGNTFSEFLLKIRINKAKELLTDKNNSIKKVAYQVGFNNPNYFSKVFHSVTGIKPTEYRDPAKNR